MTESFCKTVKKYNMLSRGDTIIAGVSGGADSLALLCLLMDTAPVFGINIHVVHINHHLRGVAADNDQAFVESFCREHDIPCSVFEYDVEQYAVQNSLSCEEAGRILRYAAFEQIAAMYPAAKIATAHHAADNCETVLHNILRGSGTTGLAGIHPVRGKYIRPLIESSRADIEAYLQEKGIKWCTDETNLHAIYTRNKIRLELIPYLKSNYNASIESAINRLSELCREDDDFLRICAEEAFSKCCKPTNNGDIILSKTEFAQLHTALKRRLVRYILEYMRLPLKDVHLVHIDDCISFILCSRSGAVFRISSCNVMLQQSGALFTTKSTSAEDYEYTICDGQTIFIESIGKSISCRRVDSYKKADKSTAFISADRTNGIFTVRNRRSGDKIHPFGLGGTKKLKDYFIDNKIDVSVRNKIPIIVYNNEVVWIAGMCLDEKYKVTSQTENILKFEIK